MRIAAAALAATATTLTLFVAGCSNDNNNASNQNTTTTAAAETTKTTNPTVESMRNKAGQLLDQGKVNTFVAGFKAGYPSLAQGRSDDDIEAILTDTCADINSGKNDDEVKGALAERVTNNGDKPSDAQTSTLYALIKPLC